LALPLLNEAYQDYCAWYDLGAGGIPHNLYGWAFQCFLRIFSSSDTRSTGCYDNVGDLELDARSFLDGPLPEREGERPEVAPFVAPHRQVSDTASEEIKDTLVKSFSQIPTDNPTLLEAVPSIMEGGTSPAIFVVESLYAENHLYSKRSPREVIHIHMSEGSSHGIFSKADCKTIIEKGWGERHGLGGKAMGIPNTYLMIYAPRTDDEVHIVYRLAKAAARYGLEGKKLS